MKQSISAIQFGLIKVQMRFVSISGTRRLYISVRCCRLRTDFEPIWTPISGRHQLDFAPICTPLSGRRQKLGDRCSPDIADVGPASISTSGRYSYRYRADIGLISRRCARHYRADVKHWAIDVHPIQPMSVLHRFRHRAFIRTDIGPTSARWVAVVWVIK